MANIRIQNLINDVLLEISSETCSYDNISESLIAISREFDNYEKSQEGGIRKMIEINQTIDAIQRDRMNLRDKNKALENQITRLQDNLSMVNDKNQQLQQKLEAAEIIIDNLQREHDDNNADYVSELKAEYKSVCDDLDSLETSYGTLQTKYDDVNDMNQELKQSLEASQRLYDISLENAKHEQTQCSKWVNNYESLCKDFTTCKDNYDDIYAELVETQTELVENEKYRIEQQDLINQLGDQMDCLVTQINSEQLCASTACVAINDASPTRDQITSAIELHLLRHINKSLTTELAQTTEALANTSEELKTYLKPRVEQFKPSDGVIKTFKYAVSRMYHQELQKRINKEITYTVAARNLMKNRCMHA